MKKLLLIMLSLCVAVPALAASRPSWNKYTATGLYQVYAGTIALVAPGALNVWPSSATYTPMITLNGATGNVTAVSLNASGASTFGTATISSAAITSLSTGNKVWQVIASADLVLTTTAITFSGLNGDADCAYKLFFVGYSSNTTGSAGTIDMQLNSDATAGNYVWHYLMNYTNVATAVTDASSAPPLTFLATGSNTTGSTAEVECFINAKKHGNSNTLYFRILDSNYDMKNSVQYNIVRSGRYGASANLTTIKITFTNCRASGRLWIEALR